MSVPFRVLLVLAFSWLALVCLNEARDKPGRTVDPSKAFLCFGGMAISGLVVGGLTVTTLLPKIGENIGNFFFNPNEKSEKHPHESAVTASARGDYAGAVNAYRKIADKNPEDTLALSEAARIMCEKLHQPEQAAAFLEEKLDREWHPEDAAFLSLRLFDVYWVHQHDAPRARQLLLQIMETLPNSKHASSAAHKLHELDRKLMMQT